MAESPLHNLDDAMAKLDKLAIRTSQGNFVKVEDVRRLVQESRAVEEVSEQVEPKPKTMDQAKAAVRRDPEIMKGFPPRNPELGRAIPAQDPHPASRP